MKIAILSRNAKLYSTRRLQESCKNRGHTAKILDTLEFTISLEGGKPDLYYKSKPLSHYDAVIPRIGASITFFGTAVVRQFEQMGVYCLSSSQGIITSRDKLRASQMLSGHNIAIPPSEFVKQRDAVMPAIEALGGSPVVIKLLEGTQGVGVILATSKNTAKAIVETLHSTRQNVLIQKFIEESKGRDIRTIVVGGRAVASMRRVAQGEEFRSNVHQGGKTEAVSLEPAYEKAAIRAAQILGLNVAGVDMLESDSGPMILEVNSSPGLEGIEKASGVDVADAIVEYLEQQAQFPEIDIRQRLTLDKGYGIAEIVVSAGSDLQHRTVKETGLREKDIVVLSIVRGDLTISNPRAHREVLPGDKLICYGKLSAMKALIAPRKPKRRKKQSSPVTKARIREGSPSGKRETNED